MEYPKEIEFFPHGEKGRETLTLISESTVILASVSIGRVNGTIKWRLINRDAS